MALLPDIATLKARYFLQPGDPAPPDDPMPAPVPETFDDCRITPLIDGSSFNAELEAALALVGTGPDAGANAGHFILIHNWFLDLSGGRYVGKGGAVGSDGPNVVDSDPYYLDGPPVPGPPATGGQRKLIDVLKAKAKVGVDIRVLGWTSIGIMGDSIHHMALEILNEFFDIAEIPYSEMNAGTMKAVAELRSDESLRPHLHTVLNTIGHTAAGAHAKFTVVGTDVKTAGFTGGIDFSNNRWAAPGHAKLRNWHDVVAKIEGPAVQALYDLFKKLWNENLRRPVTRFRYAGEVLPSFLPRTPVLPARTLPPDPQTSNHSVQSLRTIPAFNYKWYNCLPENPPISFAPQGLFEIRAGLRKALLAAETYIYMEDQTHWSREIFGWINRAIRDRPALRVILLTNGQVDPADPEFAKGNLSGAINRSLLTGLTALQIDRVRFFRRMIGDVVDKVVDIVSVATVDGKCHLTINTTASEDIKKNQLVLRNWFISTVGGLLPVVGNPAIDKNGPVILIVDPPPAGCPAPGTYERIRRVGAIIHSKTTLIDDQWALIGSANNMRRSLYSDIEHGVTMLDSTGALVQDYRIRLWADHFRHPTPADFADLQAGLHAWEPGWGTAGAAPVRPPQLVSVPLPMVPDPDLTEKQQAKYDEYEDLDTRTAWGGLCP